MHPEEVRTRAKRGLIPGGENRAPLGLINRIFLSSVGRTVVEPHDIDATNCGSSVESKDRPKLAGRLRMRARAAHSGR
jgi:hypothetical protein